MENSHEKIRFHIKDKGLNYSAVSDHKQLKLKRLTQFQRWLLISSAVLHPIEKNGVG